jgi:hypothetical protein
MKKALSLALFLFFSSGSLWAQDIDHYGGLKTIKCAKATGHFRVEKLGNRWWFCTPEGHGFFMEGVYDVIAATDKTLGPATKSKYGDSNGPAWAEATLERLKSWGFNTLGIYASARILPIESSQAIKLPFIAVTRPALYSMRNPLIGAVHSKPQRLLQEPVKNMLYGASPFYRGYRPGNGAADYYDGKMKIWLEKDLKVSQEFTALKSSPYASYLIGIGEDDGDEMFGFGAGDAFPTMPPGHNNPNLSWLIATISPVQTANARYGAVYADTSVHTKRAWRDSLAAKYGTIQALNKAWGSNYTTFDSAGTPVTGEAVGAGDGSTLSFRHKLAHPVASPFSVQILINGTPAGGDIGNGKLYGPTISSGSIDYATGEITFDFTAGDAPKSGAKISVSYIQNGWGIGSGLMDEDGRPSHRAWLGSDYVSLKDTKPAVRDDLNAFLYSVASQYLGVCHDEIKAAFPDTLLLGPDSIGSWGTPARAPVLRAASQYIDVLSGPGDIEERQAALDYLGKYFGDKPIIEGQYRAADPDSPWASYASPVNNIHEFATQQARGQSYRNALASLLALTYTANGSHPFIGEAWWQYSDNRGEKRNWGLITLLDNAYDGHEDVKGVVPCSPPLEKYRCGGEDGNYGDVISLVRNANLLWIERPETQ